MRLPLEQPSVAASPRTRIAAEKAVTTTAAAGRTPLPPCSTRPVQVDQPMNPAPRNRDQR